MTTERKSASVGYIKTSRTHKMSKPLKQMTPDELREEYLYWDTEIRAAPSWGAYLAAAYEFRADLARELRLRNEEIPNS